MVKAAADFYFKVEGIEMEGFNDAGVDVQYPWEDIARRYHEHTLHLPAYYIDKFPVTNAEFKKFLDTAHYHPADDLNFLKDWQGGNFPEGWAGKPVTWVSLEDARAYARGRVSGYLTSGSGNTPPRAATGASIPGATPGMRAARAGARSRSHHARPRQRRRASRRRQRRRRYGLGRQRLAMD